MYLQVLLFSILEGTKIRANYTGTEGVDISNGIQATLRYFDAYCMDTAPFNIFENQVIPTGLHDVPKSFRPNLATARVFSMGTKFIPV